MGAEVLYMLVIIAAGFAVNYTLRALPFILFAGRDRALPGWVTKLGAIISPVIIGGLIIYSFATLKQADGSSACRTYWPFAAGILTVVLQLWRRNALASIVAGTVVYMLLLNCGCATRQVSFDAQNPAVAVTAAGVRFGEETVRPEEVPGLLAGLDVPRDRVIHILIGSDVREGTAQFADAKHVMGALVKAGYKRPILVRERTATSAAVGKRKPAPKGTPAAQPKQKIRYKPTVQ